MLPRVCRAMDGRGMSRCVWIGREIMQSLGSGSTRYTPTYCQAEADQFGYCPKHRESALRNEAKADAIRALRRRDREDRR